MTIHKVYIYADLINQRIDVHPCNFWSSGEALKTGLYKTEHVAFQLLEAREIEFHQEFDFVSGKIKALELQLGDLHIKSENIKAQIQELKCIGHESITEDSDITNFL